MDAAEVRLLKKGKRSWSLAKYSAIAGTLPDMDQ
jgi:hypothetical protein